MSSKRALRRRSCTSKQRHASWDAANAALRSLRSRKGDHSEMQAYRCPFCSGFHFGHTGQA